MSIASRPLLRALTYLAPGIPREFFELVTASLARALEVEVTLRLENRISGPMHGDEDLFGEGKADLGFLCSPSYLYLRAQESPSVELVPAGFVFADPRSAGRPVYFSDVVVRADHSAREFRHLESGVWGYNDECSLSGYFSTQQKLAQIGCNGTFFERRVRTGSHIASIEAVLAGEIDGAAIDSTVLDLHMQAQPELAERLRIVESWGPFPIQPVVVRQELAATWNERLADALLQLRSDREAAPGLARFGFDRCVPMDDAAYADERRVLCSLGHLPSPNPQRP